MKRFVSTTVSIAGIAAMALLSLTARVAAADTVVFGAAEISLPDEGWVVEEKDGHMLLALEKGGAIIEIYNFSKAPAADKAVIGKLVGGRKDTTDVEVTSVTPNHEQHGLRGVAFGGSARIGGKPVAFSSVSLDGLRGRAVLAIAFMRAGLDARTQREVKAALGSLRAARAE